VGVRRIACLNCMMDHSAGKAGSLSLVVVVMYEGNGSETCEWECMERSRDAAAKICRPHL